MFSSLIYSKMVKTTIIIAIGFIVLMNIPIAESHRRYLPRNYARNIEYSIIRTCNNRALLITKNNTDTAFIKIRNDCIKEKQEEFGLGIFIAIMFWFIISIFAMSFN